jgi:hypothetical protein
MSSIPEVSNICKTESLSWQSREVIIPGFSPLITRLHEDLGIGALTDLFCWAQAGYLPGMKRWELVRQFRGSEIVGPTTRTGYEGYFGLGTNPEWVVSTQARIGQKLLDESVHQNRGGTNVRNRLFKMLTENDFLDLETIRLGDVLFNNLRSEIKKAVVTYYDKYNPAGLTSISLFRNQTETITNKLPAWQLGVTENLALQQIMYFPAEAFSLSAGSEPDIPYARDGWLLVKELGKMGHPLVRVILASPGLQEYLLTQKPPAEMYNFAFKGSRLRNVLNETARKRFTQDFYKRFG